MTVAGKINTLALSISVAASLLLTITVLQREYSLARERLIVQSFDRVQSQPQLQVAIYFKDQTAIQAELKDLIESSPTIRFAILWDSADSQLGRLERGASSKYKLAPFSDIRGDTSVAEMSITTSRSTVAADGIDLPIAPLVGDVTWDLTIPVFSVFSPLQQNISREEFGAALANFRSAGSLHVIGYVHLGISRTLLLRQILPQLGITLAMALAFILLCAIFSRYVIRRITAPFSIINRMADDIASGNAVKYQGIENSGEF